MGLRSGRETHFRRKLTVLTDRDELAFGRAIREFSPDVIFLGRHISDQSVVNPTIQSIPYSQGCTVGIMLPAPDQHRQWKINKEIGSLLVPPHVGFSLKRSKWEWMDPSKKWAFDLPLLGWAEIVVGFPRDDEELKKFAGKLLRLVNKVTRKGGTYGLDACLWSQSGGDERRALGAGERIDPSEKILLNKYYDDALWDDRLPVTPAWSRNIEPPGDIRRLPPTESLA